VSANVGPITFSGGGSESLLPEDSKSWSVGAILTPRFAPGLRISLDYTRIDKSNEIRTLTAQQILNLEDALPGRITRAPLTPADVAAGYTAGAITAINTSSVNVAVAKLAAYDLQLDYTIKTDRRGTLLFYIIGTHQPYLKRQTIPSLPFVDSVGYDGGVLEWRANGGITWDYGPWTVGWSMQYYDSYRPYPAGSSDASIAAAVLGQGSARIPSQSYHDVFARYRFPSLSGFAKDLEVALGIQNLLDKQPPIVASTASALGYSPYGDPRLRRFTVTVRKSF
jgi:outer membrane receptor protein involved in Fe transport